MESNFVKVAEKSEVPAGKIKGILVEGKEILIANVDNKIYAIGWKCTHAGGDLSKGNLEGNVITCPRHHAKFDLTTGKALSQPKMGFLHPKANDEPSYQVKIENENIMVKV